MNQALRMKAQTNLGAHGLLENACDLLFTLIGFETSVPTRALFNQRSTKLFHFLG